MKNLDKWFLLNWRKLWIIVVSAFAAIMLHNLVYGLCIYIFGEGFWKGGDEPVFFIITMLIVLYFLICVVYSFFKKIIDGSFFEKKFLLRAIMALVIGVVAGYLIVEFTFINPMGFWSLVVVFSFIAYYLFKLKWIKRNGKYSVYFER